MTPASEVKVWDPLIRVFHWATVTLCLLNFFVLEEGSKPHRYAGYAVGILLIIRLLWGLVGPHYARFGQWWPTLPGSATTCVSSPRGATPTTSATIRSAP
ncbi:hypothetical protein WP8S18E04_03970 [Aeromonas caviae]|nr:hypothetical protein WP8S18E04_03970 [Aeromonas caviae]